MELLQSFLDNAQWPVLSAFILGLMTAISPCPLATNITAIGFISKDVQRQQKVFINGLIYTLGRALSYTALGSLFFFGGEQVKLSGFLQQWGERLLGPLFLIIALFMLGAFNFIRLPFGSLNEKMERHAQKGFWGTLFLGIVFALAFCPYSGVLYFGLLIPLTLQSTSGLALPLIFALATGIPVIIFAWILSFSAHKLNQTYMKIKHFESWFRRIIALLFLGMGLYYISIYFIL